MGVARAAVARAEAKAAAVMAVEMVERAEATVVVATRG